MEEKNNATEVIDAAAKEKVPKVNDPKVSTEGPGSGSESNGSVSSNDKSILSNLGTAEDKYGAQDYFNNKFNQSEEAGVIDAKHQAEAQAASTKSAGFVAKNAAQANENYVRNEYQSNQTVDKSGWTGGYALDTKRQLDYLKSSIQADIYSQQELQKLGYQSNLEQARMAAEQEKNQLAYQRYQAAQQEAIQKAQLTGTYLEPHIADMLTQFSAAQADLKSGVNKDKADKVIKYVQDFFSHMSDSKKKELGMEGDNIISIKGIETLASIKAKAEAEYNRAMAEKEDIIIKNSVEQTRKEGELIPYFTDNGKLAGYGNTVPTGDITKKDTPAYNLNEYFKENPSELDKSAKGFLDNLITAFSAKDEAESKAGNPNYSINDFLKTYDSKNFDNLLNTYAPNRTRFKHNGLTLEKQGDGSWKIIEYEGLTNIDNNNKKLSETFYEENKNSTGFKNGNGWDFEKLNDKNEWLGWGSSMLKVPDEWVNSSGNSMNGDHMFAIREEPKNSEEIINKIGKNKFDKFNPAQLFLYNEDLYIKSGPDKIRRIGTSTTSYDTIKKQMKESDFNF